MKSNTFTIIALLWMFTTSNVLGQAQREYFEDGGCYAIQSLHYNMSYSSENNTVLAYSSENNTVLACRTNCSQMSFSFASVEDGHKCICHNETPQVTNLRSHKFCNNTCPGNQKKDGRKTCGGRGFRNVYDTFEDAGCYIGLENQSEIWIQKNISTTTTEHAIDKTTTTEHAIDKCIYNCFKSNFEFAAFDNSSLCYCSNNFLPSMSQLVDCESGINHRKVFKTAFKDGGCYDIENPSQAKLFNLLTNELANKTEIDAKKIKKITIKKCRNFCSKGQFLYTAVFGRYCSCGENAPPKSKQRRMSVCSLPCEGDMSPLCGGVRQMNVFNTFAIGGCYQKNKNWHLIKGNDRILKLSECTSRCRKENYAFSGFQNGSLCFCGNKPLENSKLVSNNGVCTSEQNMIVYRAKLKQCKTRKFPEEGITEIHPCQFPFEHKDNEYYKCIVESNQKLDRPWCITNKISNNTEENWGYCDSSVCDITEIEIDRTIIVIISLAIISILILMIMTGLIKYHQQKKQLLKSQAEIQNMLKGDPVKLDRYLPLIQQISYISYDTEYELRDHEVNSIAIEGILGDGQFGVVSLATMKIDGVGYTKVAIKEVKNSGSSNTDDMLSLIGELKILSNIGEHFNLVNLLGASTTDGVKVILEYCQHGDLKKFLIEKRDDFIASIDNEASQPINPHLLLKWSFSIAKGMEYLSSNRIMHGDLAARNIFLSKNYVPKIGDFGLSKEIEYGNSYRKTKRRMIPWAWMALEYLQTGTFNIKSDIWSFGVVLWEIFTLGNKPYDIQTYEDVKNKLIEGYRLEAPKFMEQLDESKKIYSDIMIPCWNGKAEDRPDFKQLVEMLGTQLGEEGVNEYNREAKKNITRASERSDKVINQGEKEMDHKTENERNAAGYIVHYSNNTDNNVKEEAKNKDEIYSQARPGYILDNTFAFKERKSNQQLEIHDNQEEEDDIIPKSNKGEFMNAQI